MNDKVKQLEERIERAEGEIANLQDYVNDRKAELEEAKKPEFKPFELVIKVTDRGQAKALRRLAGADVRMADALSGVADGKFTRTDAGNAVSKGLDPLFRHICHNGDYLP